MQAYVPKNLKTGDTVIHTKDGKYRTHPIFGNTIRFPKNASDEEYARHNIFPVTLLSYPPGGDVRKTKVVLDQNRKPVQQGTILTAEDVKAEKEQDKIERKNEVRTEQLTKHPELVSIFNQFLQICSVINGIAINDPNCKMGFTELLNVQNNFENMTAEEQQGIINRAAASGFEGSTAKEILSSIAEKLITIDVWGKRFDILEDDLKEVGGWWEICQYIS